MLDAACTTRRVIEHSEEVGGVEVFWREAPAPERGPDAGAPVVYVHGVPTSSDDWLPFLDRTGGLALDLPGFGRSGKPADFPYAIDGYAPFIERWLDAAGVGSYRLVVHDWGAVALAAALRAPKRVERLVVMNAVPLLAGYEWHRWARVWRTPIVGELAMGFSVKPLLRRVLASASPGGKVSDDLAAAAWSHFDHGTQRAILKLYRSAPPHVLAAAGERLGDIQAPALVAWGVPDRFIPAEFAQRYADALGGPAEVELIDDARHWSWFGRTGTVDLVADFLSR